MTYASCIGNNGAMSNRGKALELRLAGLTYAQIGEELSISRQRVQQLVAPPPAIRRLVVQRAKSACQRCGLRVGESGHVHHIGSTDGDTFNDVDNLELLCIPCHHRSHWQPGEALALCTVCGLPVSNSKSPQSRHTRCRAVRVHCIECGEEIKSIQASTLKYQQGDPRYTGKQVSALGHRHKKCLLGPLTAPCRECGAAVKLNPQQRHRLRNGQRVGVPCRQCDREKKRERKN